MAVQETRAQRVLFRAVTAIIAVLGLAFISFAIAAVFFTFPTSGWPWVVWFGMAILGGFVLGCLATWGLWLSRPSWLRR